MIAAVAVQNRVIGHSMELPWRLSEDLKRFKRLTLGHPVVMGRLTFESLVNQMGGPLPGRRNIVLTSQDGLEGFPDLETYPSVDAVLTALADEPRVFIGGGESVYAAFLPLADRLELTLVDGPYEGDAYFPPYEHLVGRLFTVSQEEAHEGFRFVTYGRAAW